MGLLDAISSWPVLRQMRSGDVLGRGEAVRSAQSIRLRPRTESADKVVASICPYCAVGCSQLIYVKDNEILQVEGNPDSPISRGRLCPKGSATHQLLESPTRQYRVKYRRPHGTEWEELPLERAMQMIADRVLDARASSWEERDEHGAKLRRTTGFAHLGGATLDNEENYLIKKLFTALGAIQVENQARI
jgi:formate dehydrogenase major subunit